MFYCFEEISKHVRQEMAPMGRYDRVAMTVPYLIRAGRGQLSFFVQVGKLADNDLAKSDKNINNGVFLLLQGSKEEVLSWAP